MGVWGFPRQKTYKMCTKTIRMICMGMQGGFPQETAEKIALWRCTKISAEGKAESQVFNQGMRHSNFPIFMVQEPLASQKYPFLVLFENIRGQKSLTPPWSAMGGGRLSLNSGSAGGGVQEKDNRNVPVCVRPGRSLPQNKLRKCYRTQNRIKVIFLVKKWWFRVKNNKNQKLNSLNLSDT